VTVGILNGGITEQRVFFTIFFTPGSKIIIQFRFY
jgi:hypothetical protein